MEAFEEAIEDTLVAINTGHATTRRREKLPPGKGKAFLRNVKWRKSMDVIADLLRAILARYRLALATREIHLSRAPHGREVYYCIHDPNVARWMDNTRAQLLGVFEAVCNDAGVEPPPKFPRNIHGYF